MRRDPPSAHAGRGDRAGTRHRAVSPALLRGPDAAGQLRRDGPDRGSHRGPDCDRRAAAHDLRVRDAARPRRRAVRAARRVHVRRHHRRQKDRGPGRSPACRGGAAQPALAGEHRRLPPACRLHPQLRAAGVPAGRGRAAQERDRAADAGARGRLSADPDLARHRGLADAGRGDPAPVPAARGGHPPARRRLGHGPVAGQAAGTPVMGPCQGSDAGTSPRRR